MRQELPAACLEVRPHERVALLDDRPLPLTVRELALLTELVRHGGRIVSRRELYEAVWGHPYRESERSVDVYVSKLRGKLAEALPGWCFIHTHVGFGYRFAPERLHLLHTRATPR